VEMKDLHGNATKGVSRAHDGPLVEAVCSSSLGNLVWKTLQVNRE
jgi:hypothetical protein